MSIEESSEYADARADVILFESDWWMHDPEVVDLCRRIPGLRSGLSAVRAETGRVDTGNVYALVNDYPQWPADWRSCRRPVHDQLLGDRRSGRGLLGKKPLKPMAFITLGLPGSGKTGVLRQEAWNYYRSTISARDRKRDIEGYPAGAAVLDADEVRGRLPEFQGGIGSGVVQLETASLTYGPIKDRLFKSAHSAVVYDTVGDPNYIVKEVALLAEQGFAVSVLLAKLPTELAVERAVARFLETGRFVPPEYIRGREGVPESALEAVRASSIPLEGWGIWDTTCRPADHVDGAGIFAPVQMGS
ncbi:hypothetical protein BJF84_16795 [Rhodococcus sp. CUA-806]|nr:hypothetical protein BJF84_16795 [Rhodococcus sp. CUA-806]